MSKATHTKDRPFTPLNIAVLTVSDRHTPDTDTSGTLLAERITAAGHILAERALLPHDQVA
ncbi:MAG: molybdenum cofactor biosynthesis protein, partial [Asticcacaulis sp.]